MKKFAEVKFLLLIVFRCVVLLEKFHSLHLGYLFNLLVSLIVSFKAGKKIHKHYAQYVFWVTNFLTGKVARLHSQY